MGQVTPIRPYALVVEDEAMQRELLSTLLEECEFEVIACDRAEAALDVLDEAGPSLAMLFTDIELAGEMTGTELAHVVHRRFPKTTVIVTSGGQHPTRLPNEAKFIPKPWRALDVVREAERSLAAAA
jgi:two-component system cell cycle response regulator CpdR